MTKKRVFTTFQAAEYCKVTPNTIKNWIRSKGLIAHKTAGGHFRILPENLHSFMATNSIPFPIDQKMIRKRILLVDDDELVLKTMTKLFKTNLNYLEVAAAKDGFQAGVLITQFLPDVIILDLMMPGINGFSVCESIKSNPYTRHIKVVIFTGYGSAENKQRSLDCGADIILKKPIKDENLLEVIDELFKK